MCIRDSNRTKRSSTMRKMILMTLVAPAVMAFSSVAYAQEPPKEGRGVITIPPITITSRIQKPVVAADVSRMQPKLTLVELWQPFLERIGAAIGKDPF